MAENAESAARTGPAPARAGSRDRTGPAPARLALRTADLDEARSAIGTMYYDPRIDLLDSRHPLDTDFSMARLGPFTVGELCCGADVRMRFEDLRAYHVDLPLTGRLAWRQGAQQTRLATPDRAAVFQPEGRTTLERWDGSCRLLAVKVAPEALVRHLELLVGDSLRAPLRLAPTMDLTAGPGRSWARLVRLVTDEIDDDHGLLRQPLLAAELQDSLLTGLLLATGHPWREALDRPAPHGFARPVKRVVEVIRGRPEHPFTTTELAEVGGVSARWLQEVFRRQTGTTPMGYLREVRMERVRDELLRADPAATTVSDVAYRWGFGHLGRFADKYRARFGELPSQTLRSR
ncbi:transcriptional regulator, AraC family [Streptomyces sp. 1222.5]|uniref:AraC family transcriptional regulator n=1 Tax=unclassified Streptomyces TaxID=2593676 RepID=UPI00089B565D|nr:MULTISPECIES: AraC family transcriptional regulator [unclassified Streptomyces]PKW11718.1 AraC family transcriptional regulator [Streptomyces sp. 5112.2]SEB71700.1 transcriptional regulator, AraC family [Streptomyces sp. 1222.5]